MRKRFLPNRNLTLLWTGHVISHSGDAIYQIGLPWLILELTGSKTATSLVALGAYLPAVIFSLFAGVLADRFDRRRVMIFSDITRMIGVGLLAAYLLTGGQSPLVIGSLAFAVAACATLFYPARDALIPELVAPVNLNSANSLIMTSGQFAHLAGPVLAGTLVVVVGLFHLFTIDALTFGASLLTLLFITHRRPVQARPETATHLADLREGLQYVWRKRPLGLLILLTALNNLFIMGPAVIGMPIFVREVLQMNFQAFAVIEAMMAAGMLAGTLLVWRFGKRFNQSAVLFIGMILDGLTYALFFWIDTYLAAKIFIFIHGIGIPMITIPRTNILQRVVPRDFQGRVFSMVTMSVTGLTAISAALIGPLAEFLEISTIFLVIGISAAICGTIGLSHRGMMTMTAAKVTAQ